MSEFITKVTRTYIITKNKKILIEFDNFIFNEVEAWRDKLEDELTMCDICCGYYENEDIKQGVEYRWATKEQS